MIVRLLTVAGVISGVLSGLTQAYPQLLPGGEFYLGWSAVVLGLSSLAVPALLRFIRLVRLDMWITRVLAEAPLGQGIEINATHGDIRSQQVARYLETALRDKGHSVLFQFKMHSIPLKGYKFTTSPPVTVIDVGGLDDPN